MTTSATFYAVGIYTPSLGRIVTATYFAEDAGEARSRAEIEGLNGHGLAGGETIEYASPLHADHIPDDHASALADAFNAGHTLGMADARLEDSP